MGRVSSASKDAAKSAEIKTPPSFGELIWLRPGEIDQTGINKSARPGPSPPDEEKAIRGLAQELLKQGQIVPLIVTRSNHGGYVLIDGARRLRAAEWIENNCKSTEIEIFSTTREPFSAVFNTNAFPLHCVVVPPVHDETGYERMAIHANIKRRGLTALQLAHLISNLRLKHGWSGTAEVAKYLNVSRATVSEHDKLLRRPENMPQAAYDELLELLRTGRMGASTAFYALTHVEYEKSGEILKRAQELAGASVTGVPLPDTMEVYLDSPRGSGSRESVSDEPEEDEIPCSEVEFDRLTESYSASTIAISGTIRKPVQVDADDIPYVCVASSGRKKCQCYALCKSEDFDGECVTYATRAKDGENSRNDPDGFYHSIKVSYKKQAYVLVGPPVTFVPETAKQPANTPATTKVEPRVEKKHLKQAAAESGAVNDRTNRTLPRTLPELRRLLDQLSAPSFTDPQRRFISFIAGPWWRGEADNTEVITKWRDLAKLIRVRRG
jgi:transcriptional regulator with XRE-family HTH domain